MRWPRRTEVDIVAIAISVPAKKISTVAAHTQNSSPRTPSGPGSQSRARVTTSGTGCCPRT